MELLPGYLLDELIFEDEQFILCRVNSKKQDQKFLAKKLKNQQPSTKELANFHHEVRILKEFEMEGIPKVLSHQEKDGNFTIFSEDFDGTTLAKWLQANSPTIPQFLSIATQLCKILSKLHRKGLIHKSINPYTVLISKDGKEVKLVDFTASSNVKNEIPQSQPLVGSKHILPFQSPEQSGRTNQAIDHRSDFYSLGVVLYLMAARRLPFEFEDLLELTHAQIARIPESPSLFNPTFPETLGEIILKLLSKTGDDRYQGAEGIMHDLEISKTHFLTKGFIPDFELGKMDYHFNLKMPDRIYGRKAELEVLDNCTNRLFDGLQTNLFISGESGVGKTKMVSYLKKNLISKKGLFVEGKFDQFNQNVPYSAVIECFEDLLDQILKSKPEDLHHLINLFRLELGQNSAVLTTLIPKAKLIFGDNQALAPLAGRESENRFRLTIRQFLYLFSKHVKPLGIFLDDFQWADAGSLALAKWLQENSLGGQTLFVCAYRSEPRYWNSYFEKWIAEVSESQDNKVMLTIPPMQKRDFVELLSETLLREKEEVENLAERMFHKTNGNPFFISEILRQLSTENIVRLELSEEKVRWVWDEDRLNSLKITDNVVDLVISRTESLSPNCLDILCAASCINKTFDFHTLQTLFPEKDRDTLARGIVEALESELIFPINENHRFIILSGISLNASFCFAHDRIQQALYSIQPKTATQKIHYTLARLGEDQAFQPSEILEVASHYLMAEDLIFKENEKLSVAETLIQAGIIAKENNAPAAPFLNLAIKLLPENCWKTLPEETFRAYFNLAQSEFIHGNPPRALSLLDFIEEKSKNLKHQISAICEKIGILVYTLKFEEAAQECVKGFKNLNYQLPDPSQDSIGKGLGEVLGLLGDQNPHDLIRLDTIQDEQTFLINKVLYSQLPCAFLSGNGQLWMVTVLEMTKILLTKGLSIQGALGLCSFGMIMGAVIGDKMKALRIGEASIKISEKLNDPSLDPQLKFVTSYFLAPWVKNKDYFDPLLDEAIGDGLKFGDLGYTGFSIQVKYGLMIYHGNPLSQLISTARNYHSILQTIRQGDASLLHSLINELAKKQQEENPENNIILEKTIAEWIGEMMGNKLYNVLGIFLNFHCSLANLHGNHTEVLGHYALLSQLEEAYFSNLMVPAIKLQYFISKALLYLNDGGENPEKELKELLDWTHSQNQADNDFFQGAISLMNAYLTWISKGPKVAILEFEEALSIAKKTGNFRNMGLIQESLFQIYLSFNNLDKAKSYFGEALHAYNKYGSIQKVHCLRQNYPQFAFETQKEGFKTGDSQISGETDLDYLSVIKSIQVLSAETDIDTLLTSLLQICQENAGAERGRYFKVQNGNSFIQAQIGNWSDISSGEYPDGLINFVLHSQESVVLHDASSDERFGQDFYFQKHPIKSVICVPIRFKQKLKGLVYLENNLAFGAFGENIAEILRLLSTQMGISIENAELYTSLEETNKNLELKVKERTRELSRLYSENEMLLLNMLPLSIAQRLKAGETFISDHFDNVSVLFVDIVNFTTISENLSPKKLVHELHSYFQTFDQILEKYGLEKIKTIGDAYLAVAGLPNPDPEHAIKCIQAAAEMLSYIRKSRSNGGLFEARVGISSGPLVAGVVGEKKFAYDIWGDTVNIAARMEQNSLPGQINLSGATYELVKDQIPCKYRGKLPAKNKGEIDMYFVILNLEG
ncbi:adenylate/guanylate cyclase domain-containing protein [Algoriphagus mannitolivorans]|uniref:adenylate/guanylate cyclase domain-containing protein n=1 Tax=Algoriphagus mannitolivorans TaxID=226504 RepID=UPI00047B87A6|nr:adenylate/guanylate cyclase domain-containing protein [Algoriphagus mannitolivorans]